MMTMVIGGSGSGKSEYAEKLLSASPEPRCYLATMQVWDEECRLRVERHRRMRTGKGFRTIEVPLYLEKVHLDSRASVLLEDVSNLLANEHYDPKGRGERAEDAVYAGIMALHARAGHLILVCNEIFCDGIQYEEETTQYLRELASLHRRLAAQADNLCEVVFGQPWYYKGKEPG